jgi:deoxyribodipyrimidine photo-lyase
VAVFFSLIPDYPNANARHYAFMLQGLREAAAGVEARGCAFVLRVWPEHDLARFCSEVRPALVVGDENTLRAPEGWRRRAAEGLRVPFLTVDADVVVPSRLLTKGESAARTIRPKLWGLVERHGLLAAVSDPEARVRWKGGERPASRPLDDHLLDELPLDRSAAPVAGARGGTAEALRKLSRFTQERLADYPWARNRPEVAGTSELSAHLHFGQVSVHTVALAVQAAQAPEEAKAAYLEELIVRRELAVNLVRHNPAYDRLAGCPEWARRALAAHRADPRPRLYPAEALEAAETDDPLWNAAQREMVVSGRMHGYLRMYWGKKILEWSRDPEEAFEVALRLNDRYELDGRDPNGYAGIAWAVCGRHDRPWPPRPVFGPVRAMSRQGMERKFDVRGYIERVEAAAGRGR